MIMHQVIKNCFVINETHAFCSLCTICTGDLPNPYCYMLNKLFITETFFGSTHVGEQLLFSIVPSILTLDFDLILGHFWLLGALMGYFWGRGGVQKLFWGLLI